MIFSELSLIEKETGLKYDPETATLSGVKNGVPVVVFDNDKKHRFDIVCGAVITERQFGRIYIMAERFPKKNYARHRKCRWLRKHLLQGI